MTSITLSRLDRAESTQLAGALTTELPPVLLARIAMQADSVPLLIEELAEGLDRARQGSGHHAADDRCADHPARLAAGAARPPAGAKQVAQVGAVIGREFSHELISEVTDLPEPVFSDGLEQLALSGLVHRRGEPPSATYRFRHALVQRAVYSTVLRSHRQVAHGRIADALSGRADVAPQTFARTISTEAGRLHEAVEHWLIAGQALAGRSAEREAINLFRRGLAAPADLAGEPGTGSPRARVADGARGTAGRRGRSCSECRRLGSAACPGAERAAGGHARSRLIAASSDTASRRAPSPNVGRRWTDAGRQTQSGITALAARPVLLDESISADAGPCWGSVSRCSCR